VDSYQPEEAERWPALEAVLRYRDRVRDELRASFDEVERIGADDVLAENGRVYQLVIEHELMHHETLLYMMQRLERGLLKKPLGIPGYRTGAGAAPGRAVIPAGEAELGANWDEVPFGWDNEFPATTVSVGEFEVDTTSVRNRDWLEFIAGGGYQRQELWDPESWAWKERNRVGHPAFWRRDGGSWRYLALFDDLPLDSVADWPVYVSWAEAGAYARFRGRSLPSEAQFHRACEGVAWGDPASGNFDFQNWAAVPVGSHGAPSTDGVLDLVGNGWEWTSSRFGPFPGFRPWARTYPGYSSDFFDERHYVLLGASWATDRALVRRSFRNWFQPHYPYVFAKFRTVDGPR